MGIRGPVGKRSDQLLGNHAKDEKNIRKAPAGHKPVWPSAKTPDEWHEDAIAWYKALKVSGQSRYYEQSDIATAFFLAGQMSDYLTGARRGAQMFSALITGMSLLLNTEGDRRRAGVELQRDMKEETDPGATALSKYAAMMQQRPKASQVGINDVPKAA